MRTRAKESEAERFVPSSEAMLLSSEVYFRSKVLENYLYFFEGVGAGINAEEQGFIALNPVATPAGPHRSSVPCFS